MRFMIKLEVAGKFLNEFILVFRNDFLLAVHEKWKNNAENSSIQTFDATYSARCGEGHQKPSRNISIS